MRQRISFLAIFLLVTSGCVKVNNRGPAAEGGGGNERKGDNVTPAFYRASVQKNLSEMNTVAAADGYGRPRIYRQTTNNRWLVTNAAFLFRFTDNGLLDPTFGRNGRVGSRGRDIAVSPSTGAFYSIETDGIIAFTADGQPNTSFGTAGFVALPPIVATSSSEPWSITLQNDGKIIAASVERSTTASNLVIRRFLTTGVLDSTYADAGVLNLSLPLGLWSALGLEVAGAQNILFVGMYGLIGSLGSADFEFAGRIYKVSSSGTVDSDFATTAAAEGPLGRNVQQSFQTIWIDPNSLDIYVTGKTYPPGIASLNTIAKFSVTGANHTISSPADLQVPGLSIVSLIPSEDKFYISTSGTEIFRLDANFNLDTTFGTGGILAGGPLFVLSSAGITHARQLIETDPNDATISNTKISIHRHTANGAPVTTFGTAGSTAILAPGAEYLADLAVSAQNKIYLLTNAMKVGKVFPNANPYRVPMRPQLIALGSDGQDDKTLAGNGRLALSALPADHTFAHSLSTQGENILFSGTNLLGQLAVFRLHADGTADTTFGTSGEQVLGQPCVSGYGFRSSAITLAKDGKILTVRTIPSTAALSDCSLEISRLLSNGTVDTSFGDNGRRNVLASLVGERYGVQISTQADGKILVGGMHRTPNFVDIARYSAAGTLDSTFGSAGYSRISLTTPAIPQAGFELSNLVTQSDGKIWLALQGLINGRYSFTIFRLTANGNVDPTFGTGGVFNFLDEGRLMHLGGIAIDSSGKLILAVGRPRDSRGNLLTQVIRFNADMTFDNSFGTSGIATFIQGTSVYPTTLKIQTDGKILVGGSLRSFEHAVFQALNPLSSASQVDPTHSDAMVFRLKADGSLDN